MHGAVIPVSTLSLNRVWHTLLWQGEKFAEEVNLGKQCMMNRIRFLDMCEILYWFLELNYLICGVVGMQTFLLPVQCQLKM